jgi:hypothetical protein
MGAPAQNWRLIPPEIKKSDRSNPTTVEGLRHRVPNAECRYQDRWHAAATLSMLFQISLGAILGLDRLDFLQEQTDVPAETLDVNFRSEFKV